jgi:hypothetical protein
MLAVVGLRTDGEKITQQIVIDKDLLYEQTTDTY